MSLVLKNGRVIDPGAGTDTVADVLVVADQVAGVGTDLAPVEPTEEIDVSGLIVGPGFVDLHSHVHSIAGQRLQAMDGVTTALDLEAGLMPIALAYALAAEAGRPLNYGFSAAWDAARGQVLLGREPDARYESGLALASDPRWQRDSSPRERAQWLGLLERELAEGALGIGVLLGYAPRTDPAEFLDVARLAAAAGAPTFTHVRDLIEFDPDTRADGSSELIAAAGSTGAAMHHCHVGSTSLGQISRVLDQVDRARSEGSRVTIETYPYGAGSTNVGAAFLDPAGLRRRGAGPEDVVMLATGERVRDEARLQEIRRTSPEAECVIHFLDESSAADLRLLTGTLAFSDTIVASDAVPVMWPDGSRESREWPLPPGGSTHPRTSGTYAKTLRMMVTESAAWSWVEAFRRCSYLPARVLDDVSPAARRKGHLAAGSDADLVVLDPAHVTDRATYADPTRPSDGVVHLIVGGQWVVRDRELLVDAYPGRPVRSWVP